MFGGMLVTDIATMDITTVLAATAAIVLNAATGNSDFQSSL